MQRNRISPRERSIGPTSPKFSFANTKEIGDVSRVGENAPLRLPSSVGQASKAHSPRDDPDQEWFTAFALYLENTSQLHPDFGVQHSRYASLQECTENYFKKATEVAVVAFWEPDSKEHILKCKRYFYVPYPMKRLIK